MESTEREEDDREAEQLPVVDFATFIMSLATSALMQMGEITQEDERAAPPVNMALARQSIDIIGMLQDKTRGNLTHEETRVIESVLYDLRLRFIEAKKKRGCAQG